MARDAKVALRVTEGTKAMWQRAAKFEGRTLSNWMEYTLNDIAQKVIERHFVLWDEIRLIDDGDTLEVWFDGKVVALIPRNSKGAGFFSRMDPEDAREKAQPSSNSEARSSKSPQPPRGHVPIRPLLKRAP